ncbi:hypothetical protein ACMFMF_009203 [Clarireedia jacksonii]
MEIFLLLPLLINPSLASQFAVDEGMGSWFEVKISGKMQCSVLDLVTQLDRMGYRLRHEDCTNSDKYSQGASAAASDFTLINGLPAHGDVQGHMQSAELGLADVQGTNLCLSLALKIQGAIKGTIKGTIKGQGTEVPKQRRAPISAIISIKIRSLIRNLSFSHLFILPSYHLPIFPSSHLSAISFILVSASSKIPGSWPSPFLPPSSLGELG